MHRKLAELQRVLSDAIQGMSAEELSRHLPEKWSAAEILEHLNLSYVGTIKNLERCLTAGQPRASSDRSKMRWPRLLITRVGYFPSGRKSPDFVRPRGTPAEQVTREIMQNISLMDEMISRCESRFSSGKAIADHPILGPLTATEWRGFHRTHGRHHARQILKIRQKK